jgi:hypothetical protein
MRGSDWIANQLLIAHGLALCELGTWTIVASNQPFDGWFPDEPVVGRSLRELLPQLSDGLLSRAGMLAGEASQRMDLPPLEGQRMRPCRVRCR